MYFVYIQAYVIYIPSQFTSRFLAQQVMSPEHAFAATSVDQTSSPTMPESANAAGISATSSSSHVRYTEDIVKFPMLASDGRNWATWKKRFHLSTVARGLKRHLDEKVKAPEASDPTYEVWEVEEAGLMERMALSISETVYDKISEFKTVREAYEELGTLFGNRSRMYIADVRRKLVHLRLAEGADVRPHFDDLIAMKKDLSACGDNIGDVDFLNILMASLPRSWDGYIGSMRGMMSLREEPVKPRDFMTHVIEEFERRTLTNAKRGTKEKSNDFALTTSADDKNRKKVECFNCKKKGHRKADCWAKGGGKEGEGPKLKKKGKEVTKETAKVALDNEDGVWMACLEDQDDCEATPPSDSRFDPFTFALGHTPEHDPIIAATIDSLTIDNPAIAGNGVSDTPGPAGAAAEDDSTEIDLYDSGASRHMSSYRHKFSNYRSIEPRSIRAADDHTFKAIGKGDMKIDVPNNAARTTMTLKDVLYCPNLGFTLVSVSRIAAAGYTVMFKDAICNILDRTGKIIGEIEASNGLYRVSNSHDKASVAFAQKSSIVSLHRRLGHISPAMVKTMIASKACSGLELDDRSDMTPCASCEHAKATRKPVQKTRTTPRANIFGGEIHSDVWGPSPVQTIAKQDYYISFTDDYTRWTTIYLMKKKSGALKYYQSFEAWCATQFDARIRTLRTDRGGEYMSNDFDDHLGKRGTLRIAAPHDTPEYNGVSERLNRTVLERTRAVLHASGLPKFLWGEAAVHIVWLKNRTPTRALSDGTTPFQMLYKTKPDFSRIFDWGAPIWVHDANSNKLDARGVLGRWVGLDSDGGYHRVYWPGKHSITVERSVRPAIEDVLVPVVKVLPLEGEKVTEEIRERKIEDDRTPRLEEKAENDPDDTTEHEYEANTPQDAPINTREPRIRKPSRYVKEIQDGTIHTHHMPSLRNLLPKGMSLPQANFTVQIEHALVSAVIKAEGFDPASLKEARQRSDWTKWDDAIRKELASLKAAKTWELVRRPKDKNVVGSKWVLRLKKDSEGEIDKHKARVVAKGFTQQEGVDYFETFAPVARLASIRTVLAIAARNGWRIDTFDFHSAFLNGTFDKDEEIFMEQPPEYEEKDRRLYVLRLLKTIYGLKQSSRKWYEIICRLMAELGFTRSEYDPAVFYWREGNDIMIIVIHVDDCTIAGNSQKLIDDCKAKVKSRYAMTDLGPISWVLGIKITRNLDDRTLGLSQTSYIDSILNRFNFADMKPVSTPMDPTIRYSKTQCPETLNEKAKMKNIPYREAIGALMYCAVATRPDISFAVALLSQFLENPGMTHWNGVKHVYRYLLGTKDLRLVFGQAEEGVLGYTDADGATQEHRHAISGYAFLIDGGAVSWFSRKQEIVTLSTAEAEYVAATHATKEAIWLRGFINEVFRFPNDAMTLRCDNQSAIALTKDNAHHTRTKHIDIRYHFIRYAVQDGKIKLVYCPTNDNVADVLTKALPSLKAKHFAAALGLRTA